MRKAPTLDDVARLAGVSRTLVSTALRGTGRVAPTTRERILAACKELGYRPNLSARQLASGHSGILSVLLADVLNPFFAAVADAVARHADAAGLTTFIATGQRTSAGEKHAVEQIVAQTPRGVVLLGPTMSSADLTPLLRSTPTVSISRFLDDAAEAVSIGLDELAGVRLVVDHLVGLGHRSIVHIDGGSGVSASERREAFVACTRAHGVRGRIVPGAFTAEGGYRATKELLRSREGAGDSGTARAAAGTDFPTAIWAANDMAASGVLVALREAGVRVPEEVSVVGYDDVAVMAAEQLRLTSVRQPIDEMGRLAVELILEAGKTGRSRRGANQPDGGESARGAAAADSGSERHPRQIRLKPELVVRESTGPAPRR